MPLKTSDEKQDSILKVFDYFEAESKLSLGEKSPVYNNLNGPGVNIKGPCFT
jgi:hypothetical protein